MQNKKFAKVFSAQPFVLNAKLVSVEVDLSAGLHKFSIVGLADRAIGESKDRISSAIKHSGYSSPKNQNQKIVISLAPANIKKSGPLFDLGMALAYLKADSQIDFNEKGKLFVGELSLDGRLRPVPNILSIVKFAQQNDFEEIFIPFQNRQEASLIKNVKIIPVKNLNETIEHLNGKNIIKPFLYSIRLKNQKPSIDFCNIIGQETAKRGLLISACGRHNIGLYGPPGTGKTMLARAMAGILPNLNYQKTIETTSIHSINKIQTEIIDAPPFRAPHHSASYSSIIGGTNFSPGEISLAHNGVLFLDEFPEFDRRVIESLRQPLEDKKIIISRVNEKIEYPADFIFIFAMNPCPCGYFQTNIKQCACNQSSILKYQKKISGPILDRVDMWVHVNNNKELSLFNNKNNSKNSDYYKKQVIKTIEIQKQRFKDQEFEFNSQIPSNLLEKYCYLEKEDQTFLKETSQKINLSLRSVHRIIKLARTIADLEESNQIQRNHLLEAIQYKPKKES